jgi:YfiH family protein
VIRWERPGYVVAFTTRAGGVSEGAYESLNLTVGTGDEPARVEENRRRACDALGLQSDRLSFNRQVHSPTVHRAGARGAPGDGLWSDEPELPMLAFSADCLPIAVARTDGARRLAVVHAGWRGLAGGVVAAAVSAVGGDTAAVVGPAIGPCCYEVGEDVASHFDEDLTVDRRLDLWSAAERALRRAGVATVDRLDLCTRCNPDLFFSHRRSGWARGVQGVIGAVA